MIPNWTNHLKDQEEIKRFKTYIHSSRGVLDRLFDMSKEMEKELDDQEISKDAYDSPSWAAKQADTNGSRRILRRFQRILTLDPKDK